jgi:succinate dehydrogenase / fumarate reductase iron-sulfur subunit
MRVNGRERLACITPITEVVGPNRRVLLEPLRNFPVIADLSVDFGAFMVGLDQIDLPLVRRAEAKESDQWDYVRFENCLECGLCVSACPIAGSDPLYLGPAALAAAWRGIEEPRRKRESDLLELVNDEHGVWRCHAAFECTEVCPADVNPAGAILRLRRLLVEGKGR